MSKISELATLSNLVEFEKGVVVGPFAILGDEGTSSVKIGAETRIGPYALIEDDVVIGAGCEIDAYCRVCSGARIGDGTRILYSSSVFENAIIGKKCIIGGDVADRTIIEDFVTYFGAIAHDYAQPGDADSWDYKTTSFSNY